MVVEDNNFPLGMECCMRMNQLMINILQGMYILFPQCNRILQDKEYMMD
jgi:hypothetical protein